MAPEGNGSVVLLKVWHHWVGECLWDGHHV